MTRRSRQHYRFIEGLLKERIDTDGLFFRLKALFHFCGKLVHNTGSLTAWMLVPEKSNPPRIDIREAFGRYAIGVCSVAAGLGLRFALSGVLGSTVPYITFFPAVMFAAWLGGLGPGI